MRLCHIFANLVNFNHISGRRPSASPPRTPSRRPPHSRKRRRRPDGPYQFPGASSRDGRSKSIISVSVASTNLLVPYFTHLPPSIDRGRSGQGQPLNCKKAFSISIHPKGKKKIPIASLAEVRVNEKFPCSHLVTNGHCDCGHVVIVFKLHHTNKVRKWSLVRVGGDAAAPIRAMISAKFCKFTTCRRASRSLRLTKYPEYHPL